MFKEFFYSNSPLKPEEKVEGSSENSSTENGTEKSEADMKHTLEIANGSNKNGFAKEKADLLKKDGYKISLISTFSGEKKENTRIIVKENGIGNDLLKYFKNAELEVNPKLISNGSDI